MMTRCSKTRRRSPGGSANDRRANRQDAVIGVVQAIGLPLHTVSAGVWKRALGLGPDKEKSRAMALQLWPDRSDLFGLKRQHNNAEAALLALFGAKKFPGAGP
jgi:hypothetical protein